MTEVLNYSDIEQPSSIVDDNGDIRPYESEAIDSPWSPQSEELPEWAEGGMAQEPSPSMPGEVFEVLKDAAREEDRLRQSGTSPDRIARRVHLPMNIQLAKLAAKHVDISLAFPPDRPEATREADDDLSDTQERAIDHIMDTQGLSYDAAAAIARNR